MGNDDDSIYTRNRKSPQERRPLQAQNLVNRKKMNQTSSKYGLPDTPPASDHDNNDESNGESDSIDETRKENEKEKERKKGDVDMKDEFANDNRYDENSGTIIKTQKSEAQSDAYDVEMESASENKSKNKNEKKRQNVISNDGLNEQNQTVNPNTTQV